MDGGLGSSEPTCMSSSAYVQRWGFLACDLKALLLTGNTFGTKVLKVDGWGGAWGRGGGGGVGSLCC